MAESEQVNTQLQQKINEAIATGLNAAADRALVDIEQHVAIKTGRLRDSYAVITRATPESLTAEIGSPLDYRLEQYPQQNKPRTISPPPLLVGETIASVVKAEIENAVRQEFQT